MSTTNRKGLESDSEATTVLTKVTIVSRLKEQDYAGKLKTEPDIVEWCVRRKKRASVLVPLILCDNGEVEVLLTVRAKHLRTDGGDVAFPGGKQDEEDADETATALREAWEEVGLYQADVEVVSQLPPMFSRSGYFITPITAIIPEDFEPNINPNEVDDVFRVPLVDFLKHDHHRSLQQSSVSRFTRIHFFTHTRDEKKFVTYGLTAYLCIITACSVFGRAPDFEMEPGFDHTNFAQGLLSFIRQKMGHELSSSSSKI